MAEFKINTTEAEHRLVAAAVQQLNEIQHIRYMSRSMLVAASGLKDSKLRAVLQDMIDCGELVQYAATDNPARQRWYYVLTAAGKELLKPATVE